MYRINRDINSKQVRINGKVYTLEEGIELAGDLDLVLINDKVSPPICKIVNYEKFLYEEKKKKQPKKSLLKEIKFSSEIAENDILHKIEQAKKLIKEGHKIKLSLVFQSRESIERGEKTINKFKQLLKNHTKIEKDISFENKKMFVILCKK